jgi:glycine/D-amino acid oxidase-like deaminating enzyme
MRSDILIVGQGLAGTMLAWELERAGISFAITDQGHASAATAAAAGIINPITGRRLVKSWRIDDLLPRARETYRELESMLDLPLCRPMKVRRLFADDRERTVFRSKQLTGELAPFLNGADDDGFWIRDAAWIDLAQLLAAAGKRWHAAGKLCAAAIEVGSESKRYDLVIDCRGLAGATDDAFSFVPWEFSKGELIEIAVDGLIPDVILNRRHWILPVDAGLAWVGATHESGVRDTQPTETARALLEASARALLGDQPFNVIGQRVGVRVNLPDKRPVVGRHPERPHLGVLNGLGAKGALWGPMLARQWVRHLNEGLPFDAETDVRRFPK